MHSRIFQLSASPVKEEESITESDFYDTSFLGEIADYVDEINWNDRTSQFDWIDRPGLTVDNKAGTLQMYKKAEYFAGQYAEFKKAAQKVAETTFKQFCDSEVSSLIFSLDNLVDDKFEVYVYDTDESEIVTLDTFIRRHSDGDMFYIGGVMDYHY